MLLCHLHLCTKSPHHLTHMHCLITEILVVIKVIIHYLIRSLPSCMGKVHWLESTEPSALEQPRACLMLLPPVGA